jgi:hypothetical protein
MTTLVKNQGSGQFVQVDGGQDAQFNLLLAILVELRVQSQYLQALNPQITDDLNSLRADQVSDPASLTTNIGTLTH